MTPLQQVYFNQYYPKVAGIIRKQYPSLHPSNWDDALSEAYCGLLEAVKSYNYKKSSKFSYWYPWIMIHRVNDYLRVEIKQGMTYIQRGQHAPVQPYYMPGFLPRNQDGKVGVAHDSLAVKTQAPVSDYNDHSVSLTIEQLDDLTSLEKGVLKLRYVGDMSLGDIGDRYGLSDSRISQIHADILERLRGMGRKYLEETLHP